ncbi:Os12g0452400 [Oryza sativa Japonica Group]|uniref:Os12g0452400 protein n=1 Tax=Oryza sativa subsp. japonica TaxID=39947 RepID=A0A0P0Y9S1_ORYSJ|nr:Os12g0452400 [Oryza sativa Japonica Group]
MGGGRWRQRGRVSSGSILALCSSLSPKIKLEERRLPAVAASVEGVVAAAPTPLPPSSRSGSSNKDDGFGGDSSLCGFSDLQGHQRACLSLLGFLLIWGRGGALCFAWELGCSI